ncbi:hypothetical protein STANM309S_00425 [Streptomyces tanashiensis]
MALKTVTDASFDEDVLKSDKPVLVDFWGCVVPARAARSPRRWRPSPPSTARSRS